MKVELKLWALLLGTLLTTQILRAQVLQDFPGSIPLKGERGVATDLIGPNGEELFPEDAHKIKDLSILNPKPSDIWDLAPISDVLSLPIDDSSEALNWVGNVTAPYRWLTYITSKTDVAGNQEFYQILMARQAHNILLRAKLLQKMGYRVPPIKYLKKFKLRFPSISVRDDFVNRTMIDQLDALPGRWIKGLKKKVESDKDQGGRITWTVDKAYDECMCIEIQDAIAFYSTSHIYNLSIGIVEGENMQGRRAFEALLVPFGLTHLDESLNLLSWNFGRVFNDRIFVDGNYQYADQFFPNYDDGRWAARKILKLTRQDWVDIAKFAKLPKAAETLLVEKFISRRNSLIDLFNLHGAYSKLSFDPNVSYKDELKSGKILRKEWPGYATSFSYGDPDSPMSGSELFGFSRSKIYSNIISNAISYINREFMPQTQLAQKIAEKNFNLAVDALVDGFKKGQAPEIPLGYYTIPIAGLNLIASREVVAGSIMGTENPIQLSHTFGYSAYAGLYFGGHGLPDGMNANAQAQAYVTRTFSHLQPIRSVKAALKQPYTNIAVSLMAKKMGKTLNRLMQGEFDNYKDAKGKERQEMEDELLTVVNDFFSEFEVGESLIISDYLGAVGNLNIGYGIEELDKLPGKSQAFIKAKAGMQLINRLHIYRRSDTAFQIYDDKGSVIDLNLSVGVEVAGADIIKLEIFKKAFGQARTKFTQLNTDTSKNNNGQIQNNDLLDNMKLIYSLVTNFDKEPLYAKREPTLLEHAFSQNGFKYRLLWNEGKYLNSSQKTSVTYSGTKGTYIRHSRGFRRGRNIEGAGVDAGNILLNELFPENEIEVTSQFSGDPGDSFYGESQARSVIFEARERDNKLAGPFFSVENRWRGWTLTKKRLKQIIDEINNKYPIKHGAGVDYYRNLDLHNVIKLHLYSIYLTLNVYHEGFFALTKVTQPQLRKAFQRAKDAERKNRRLGRSYEKGDWPTRETGRYWGYRNKFFRHVKAGETQKAAAQFTKMVAMLEKLLLWDDFVTFLGGEKNIFVSSRIIGFREGDERINPDTGTHAPFVSNTYGVIGSRKTSGPASFIRENLDMSEGEFYLRWIMEKL